MSYDENLAARVRALLSARDGVAEKNMFGALCFMVNGALCCGLTKGDFMVRVGAALYDEALAEPPVRPTDFTGRPLRGMVFVAPEGIRSDAALARWCTRGSSSCPVPIPLRQSARAADGRTRQRVTRLGAERGRSRKQYVGVTGVQSPRMQARSRRCRLHRDRLSRRRSSCSMPPFVSRMLVRRTWRLSRFENQGVHH